MPSSTSLGRMRHKIAIQSPTATVDSGGGRSIAWSTLKEVYADIRPTTGRYQFQHDQEKEKVTHKIIIRHRADIGTNYRVKFGSRIFNIHSILNEDERDRFLTMMCEEGGAT